VTQHGRKHAFRIIAREREGVGVAHASVGDLDQHLALAGRGDVDLYDLQRLARFKGHGGTGFHGHFSSEDRGRRIVISAQNNWGQIPIFGRTPKF
jgi:hypothetical protein